MNKFLKFTSLALLVIIGCSKEKTETNYVNDLVPYSELKNMQLFVGNTEKSTTGLNPGSFISNENLSRNYSYFRFINDKELLLTTKNWELQLPYSFKSDSLIIESAALEDGNIYLGKGNQLSLKKECGAFMFYGYRIENGQKVDVNYDGVVNSYDKIHQVGLLNKFINKQDILDKTGYGTLMSMESNDSLVIYNYTLHFVIDKNKDRAYTEADN